MEINPGALLQVSLINVVESPSLKHSAYESISTEEFHAAANHQSQLYIGIVIAFSIAILASGIWIIYCANNKSPSANR